jgi:hypothetical protein
MPGHASPRWQIRWQFPGPSFDQLPFGHPPNPGSAPDAATKGLVEANVELDEVPGWHRFSGRDHVTFCRPVRRHFVDECPRVLAGRVELEVKVNAHLTRSG